VINDKNHINSGDYAQLEGLKDAAELLAAKEDWPVLYSKEALAKTTVPCAAAVYYDDMYVERELSEATANIIPDCKVRYQHELVILVSACVR
jgi:hypothetical protein